MKFNKRPVSNKRPGRIFAGYLIIVLATFFYKNIWINKTVIGLLNLANFLKVIMETQIIVASEYTTQRTFLIVAS